MKDDLFIWLLTLIQSNFAVTLDVVYKLILFPLTVINCTLQATNPLTISTGFDTDAAWFFTHFYWWCCWSLTAFLFRSFGRDNFLRTFDFIILVCRQNHSFKVGSYIIFILKSSYLPREDYYCDSVENSEPANTEEVPARIQNWSPPSSSLELFSSSSSASIKLSI